jgi:hypothetical protein
MLAAGPCNCYVLPLVLRGGKKQRGSRPGYSGEFRPGAALVPEAAGSMHRGMDTAGTLRGFSAQHAPECLEVMLARKGQAIAVASVLQLHGNQGCAPTCTQCWRCWHRSLFS